MISYFDELYGIGTLPERARSAFAHFSADFGRIP
jgi:hypothetical protein